MAQWLGATITLFLTCLPLSAQTNQGTIQGGVFDQTGGAVVGAMVTVTDVFRGDHANPGHRQRGTIRGQQRDPGYLYGSR